jgi:ArsR family transcriptional regulator, lead/cadmium/zinc/bismuth-responsive transcriptional repressor
VLADINQIKECREKVKQVDQSVGLLANALALAGNEKRLKILFLLQEEGQLCPCDLSDILRMTVSAISQHLRKLKDGRLIDAKKTGQTIFYSVNPDYYDILKPMFKLITNNKILELI